MGGSEKIVAEIGHTYRIKRSNYTESPLFELEAYHEPYWYACQKWDDPGYVADLLVKHGVAPDHKLAFQMLKS